MTGMIYQLGGSLNMFKGNQRITIIGMSNNINNQNFSAEDLGEWQQCRGKRWSRWRKRKRWRQ
ncbi:MAG: hypothetical protein KL787_08080 [Taibaiella sp.]|nr:hypothetical protein [Taibaiella sp.]